jgi:hypothetical protein
MQAAGGVGLEPLGVGGTGGWGFDHTRTGFDKARSMRGMATGAETSKGGGPPAVTERSLPPVGFGKGCNMLVVWITRVAPLGRSMWTLFAFCLNHCRILNDMYHGRLPTGRRLLVGWASAALHFHNIAPRKDATAIKRNLQLFTRGGADPKRSRSARGLLNKIREALGGVGPGEFSGRGRHSSQPGRVTQKGRQGRRHD